MTETQRIAVPWLRIPAFFAALLAALLACATLTSSASAANYSVYSCAGPSGETLPNNAWASRLSVPSHSAAFSFGGACTDLTVLTAPGTTLAVGEDAGYAFDAPAGTTISGYSIRRSVGIIYPTSGTKPALSSGLRRTVDGAETYWGECEAVTSDCTFNFRGTQSAGLSASGLQVGVECAVSSGSCAGTGINILRARLIDSRVDIADNNAPTLTLSGGTLPGASGWDVHSLGVVASDVGGGVKSLSLAIDGQAVTTLNSAGSCTQPYTARIPCPASVPTSFSVDLAKYAIGAHSAVISATDAAGNVATLAPAKFTVGGVSANGTPAVEYPALTTRKAVISVKSSKKVAVSGILRTTTGRAIGGATLEVSAASLGGAASASKVIGSVKTGADGGFTYKAKPNGALRITFTFRPASGAIGTAAASTTLRQAIALSARRSQARLRRGSSLTISGRLTGAGRAAAGTPVEIQVKNGKRWSTIDTVTAGKSGNYKWKYRFKRVTRPTLFTFRASVPSKPGWPWSSKTSTSVRVLVLG
ncbi:MAG: hypothetical protein ACRDKE_11050 [Solirubrobacterales bacterium]